MGCAEWPLWVRGEGEGGLKRKTSQRRKELFFACVTLEKYFSDPFVRESKAAQKSKLISLNAIRAQCRLGLREEGGGVEVQVEG